MASVATAPLCVDDLMDRARKDTGLDDFGDAFSGIAARENLAALIESTRDLPFTASGLEGVRANVHLQLINKLRFHRDLREHPEILDEDVSDPLVILGMPRTGTTKLSRMLSADPAVQSLHFWRLLNPAPLPGTGRGEADPRIDIARRTADAIKTHNPDYFAAHPFVAEDADEDTHLHMLSFAHVACWLQSPSPRYRDYLMRQPRTAPYRYVKALLQYLQWQDGGRRGRRWICKNPTTIGSLDSVIETHPKATFVYCHRDLANVLPSLCGLFEAIYRQKFGEVDLHWLGQITLEFWSFEFARFRESTQRLGTRLKLLEVPYEQIVRDSQAAAEQIYAHAGLNLTIDARTAMRNWETRNPKGKHGANNYTLDRYGLTRSMIDRAFG
jgi:hypothetical protein